MPADADVIAALQREWDEFLKPTYVNNSGQTKKTVAETWRQQNPGEWVKLQEYRAGGVRPTLASSFGKQMVEHVTAWLLAQPSSPPPSTAVPLFDGRASRMTQLWGYRSVSDQGGQSPQVWDGLPFLDGDITLYPDGRFGQVYRTRLNQNSRNPYWTGQPADKPSCEITDNNRPIAMGQWDWYAMATWFRADWRLGSWGVVAQFGYPTLTSPPVALAIDTSGVGIDRHAGVVTNGTAALLDEPRFFSFSAVAEKWIDWLVGVKWAIDNTGEVIVDTRVNMGSWTTQYHVTNTPTFQVASGQAVKTTCHDKQGAYQLAPWSSFENLLYHSGLTRWDNQTAARQMLG